MRGRPDQVRAWLDRGPSLAELQEAYPAVWSVVQRELAELVPRGDLEALKAYAQRLAAPPAPVTGRRLDAALAQEVRRQMAAAAFRLLWPLLWQRRLLMPLVGPKGIYCFYSKRLIRRLAAMVGGRRALEIAAGDGTLSRFLAGAGVDVTATDDHSWRDVDFPDSVARQDAAEAVRTRRPEIVICSWPPAGNGFGREVFRTESVELSVVIGSRHRFATGAWDAYESQTGFELEEDEALGALVLPPELDAAGDRLVVVAGRLEQRRLDLGQQVVALLGREVRQLGAQRLEIDVDAARHPGGRAHAVTSASLSSSSTPTAWTNSAHVSRAWASCVRPLSVMP